MEIDKPDQRLRESYSRAEIEYLKVAALFLLFQESDSVIFFPEGSLQKLQSLEEGTTYVLRFNVGREIITFARIEATINKEVVKECNNWSLVMSTSQLFRYLVVDQDRKDNLIVGKNLESIGKNER